MNADAHTWSDLDGSYDYVSLMSVVPFDFLLMNADACNTPDLSNDSDFKEQTQKNEMVNYT